MAAVILNTLDFADKLKAGGFTAQQAETQARALAEVIERQLASKAEIEAHEIDIKRDIQESENRLELKIESLRIELKRDVTELKRDIRELELSFKKDMEILRAETKRDIAESKAELIRWVVGAGLLQSTLIIGVLLKIAHLI